MRRAFAALIVCAALGFPGAARGAAPPADPWPRQFKSGGVTILVYQPQVESWTGNMLTFRSAIGIRKADPKDDVFGVLVAKARTQVDKASRMVLLEDVVVTKRSFPTLPDNGLIYLFSLKTQLGPTQRTIALDRLLASLAASGAAAQPGVPVNNDPPRILVSQTPAFLVSLDGTPALRPIPGTHFQRVINTRAMLLADEGAATFYLRVGDGWLSAGAISGPWEPMPTPPDGLEGAAKSVAETGVVDAPEGPSAAAPAIHVSETPARLIVFAGEPVFAEIPGTTLGRASNTANEVFRDAATSQYFVLLAGRWFRAADLAGPWVFVPSTELPPDFRKIPADAPGADVPASVAGTPQSREALSANGIPQTAAVKRIGGPTFAPKFDGAPQLAPVDGTSLQCVVNSPTPMIQVNPNDFYAVRNGVWFTSPALGGPWVVAATLPAAISAIPPSSPLHFVTYVQIFSATIGFVYEGYTPGYLGSIATPEGVVVHGTGYGYPPWIGSAWYPAPATYASWGGPSPAPKGGLYGSYRDALSAEVRSVFTTESGGIVSTNPRTGKASPYGLVQADNDVYVDKDGQVYSNAGGRWQQHSSAGWSDATADMAWADRESQARAAGEIAFQRFSQSVVGAAPPESPAPSGTPKP